MSLHEPMDCSPPSSSVHGVFQARVLEWVPLPSPARCSRNKNIFSHSTDRLMGRDNDMILLGGGECYGGKRGLGRREETASRKKRETILY